MLQRGLSQSELGRRVGVAQATIYKLVKGESYGSKYLHVIARELGTTPAYLTGEIDDPDAGAPPPQPARPARIMLEVGLPPENALAKMFEALLRMMPDDADLDERALLLARRLPIGLSQLRDLIPAGSAAGPSALAAAEAPPTPAHEPQS